METQKRYEIGGVCVVMTPKQANIWNEGGFNNWRVFAGAYVAVPRRGKYGHPYEDFFSLEDVVKKDIEKMYSTMMEDSPANEVN
jgi:hypothetical protein